MYWFGNQVLWVSENPFKRVGTMLGHVLLNVGDVVFAFGSLRFESNCSERSALDDLHFLDHLTGGRCQGWSSVVKVAQDVAALHVDEY